MYKDLMEKIGVNINLTKTLKSTEGHLRIEFAKRILYNGDELTPLGYKLLKTCGKSIYTFPIILEEVNRRGWWSRPEDLDLCPGSPNQKGFELLFLLSKCPNREGKFNVPTPMEPKLPITTGYLPINCGDGNITLDYHSKVLKLYLRERGKNLERKALAYLEESDEFPLTLHKVLKEGGQFEKTILNSLYGSYPLHALSHVIRERESRVYEIQKNLHNLQALAIDHHSLLLDVIEYVPTLLEETLERDKRIQEARVSSRL
jgi:hypothetical protein